jgi:hypothetical protein
MTPTTYSAPSDSPLTEHEKEQIVRHKNLDGCGPNDWPERLNKKTAGNHERCYFLQSGAKTNFACKTRPLSSRTSICIK